MRGRPPLSLIFGRMKSGKSFHAKRMARKAPGRVWIWDPNKEWAGPDSVDGIPGCWPATNWDHCLRILLAQGDPAPRIAFQVGADKFPEWCDLVRYCGNMLAIVDEAHETMGPRKLPPQAMSLVRRTRHSRVDLVLVAQRPTAIDVNVRSQAHGVVTFQMSEALDLDWIGGHCGPDIKRRVPDLAQGEFVEWVAGAHMRRKKGKQG